MHQVSKLVVHVHVDCTCVVSLGVANLTPCKTTLRVVPEHYRRAKTHGILFWLKSNNVSLEKIWVISTCLRFSQEVEI